MMKLRNKMISASALLLATAPAMAHTGVTTGSGLLAGLSHPLTGLDHLVAMLALGGWAAMQSQQQKRAIPAAFTLMLLTGFLLAVSGLVMPFVESTIAVSVLFSGLLVATAVRLPAAFNFSLISVFALAHGQAHGMEATAGTLAVFAAGFLLSSVALQLAGGLIASRLITKTPLLTRMLGSAIAVLGSYLLITV